MCEWWKKTPCHTSKDLKANLEQSGVMVSTNTIRRTLIQTGLHGRRPRKTPSLRKKHKKEQLIFVIEYLDKPQSFWENVLWPNETKIELSGNAHQQFVYRRHNEGKQHRTNSKAWWRIHDAVKSENYQEILEWNVQPTVRKLSLSQRSWVPQQDEDPKHTGMVEKGKNDHLNLMGKKKMSFVNSKCFDMKSSITVYLYSVLRGSEFCWVTI